MPQPLRLVFRGLHAARSRMNRGGGEEVRIGSITFPLADIFVLPLLGRGKRRHFCILIGKCGEKVIRGIEILTSL